MLIKDFYANREIFITGGTGFLGKSLIEKLLRDCPKIKVVYLLLRGKQTISAEQRLEELKNSKIFDRIRQECPDALNKLYAIHGDSSKLGLDIKAQDMDLLRNVSIIFHMAANVKFEVPLRSSILTNTRGTYELVKIAEKLKNLLVFFHCSTAYCNPFEEVVHERVYKMPVDWRKTIKIAETFDEETLNTLFLKYTGYYPNTYTFTKNLSEQLIQEYSAKLPMFVFRPSIVMNSFKEPVEGYTDNLNGPLGGLVALSIGITPVLFSDTDLNLDSVPVDMVSRLTVVAAYKRGLQTLNKELKHNSMEVVNCASGGIFKISISQAAIYYDRAINKNPMENCIWRFDMPRITPCYFVFLLYFFLINIPVAITIDIILRLMGQQPLLLKFQRRIMHGTKVVKSYMKKQYNFINRNMINLENSIPLTERNDFGSQILIETVDYGDYFENVICGIKQYLFNQPIQASNAAIRRYRIFGLVNTIIKYFLLFLLLKYLYSVASSS